MPSSYKTSFLKLNRFIGIDKPKMDDFNNDNMVIDNELKSQSEKIAAVQSHVSDTQNHITPQERASWNNLLWEVGTYVGDGGYTKNVNIGFKPRLGFIFQKDEFLITSYGMGSSPQSEQRSAVLTPVGCSLYTQILDNGFMVCNTIDVAEDFRMPKLNIKGITYVY
ncbi:MAG: hypothetical protein RR048_03405, partial [Oscillospiraceae bacterium]